MKLDWFRKNKMFVWWILLPVVFVSFVFWGAYTKQRGTKDGFFSGSAGPGLEYPVGHGKRVLNPSEVINLRTQLTLWRHRGGSVSSAEVGVHLVSLSAALSSGFECGTEEMKEHLMNEIKSQLSMREPGETIPVTDDIFEKLLHEIPMSHTQFDQLSHQEAVIQKHSRYIYYQTSANDAELFVAYCREKELVRFRFSVFKSEDFLAKAQIPSDEKTKEFYDKNKGLKQEYLELLFTKPKISADLLASNSEKIISEIKVTDSDLQKFYDGNKSLYWKVPAPPKSDQPPPSEIKEEFKPFADVKSEVEKKWKDKEIPIRMSDEINKRRNEFATAIKSYSEEQARKPEADRKAFDVAGWAKTNGLIHWTTSLQTEEQYKAGKKELNAPDAAWIETLFNVQRGSSNPRASKIGLKEFTFPQAIDPGTVEKGQVMYMLNTYQDEQLKPYDEAKGAISEHLKYLDAIDLAKKEAEKVRGEWVDGKSKIDLDVLEEESGTSTSNHALIANFFKSPKPVGEILGVAEGSVESKPDVINQHKLFYVGFAVERMPPTWKTFEKDTTWNRDQERKGIVGAHAQFYFETLDKQRRAMGKKLGNDEDPDLFKNIRGDSDD